MTEKENKTYTRMIKKTIDFSDNMKYMLLISPY